MDEEPELRMTRFSSQLCALGSNAVPTAAAVAARFTLFPAEDPLTPLLSALLLEWNVSRAVVLRLHESLATDCEGGSTLRIPIAELPKEGVAELPSEPAADLAADPTADLDAAALLRKRAAFEAATLEVNPIPLRGLSRSLTTAAATPLRCTVPFYRSLAPPSHGSQVGLLHQAALEAASHRTAAYRLAMNLPSAASPAFCWDALFAPAPARTLPTPPSGEAVHTSADRLTEFDNANFHFGWVRLDLCLA